MNFFSHAVRFLDEPFFVAGTAVPDWVSLVPGEVRARVRRDPAFELTADSDKRIAALGRGIIQHHDDDRWFHTSATFTEMQWDFARRTRDRFPEDQSMRSIFLGHILVELLLDAKLIEDDVARLDVYYKVLESVEKEPIVAAVNRIATRSVDLLAVIIPRWIHERFLYDYPHDARLLYRVNRVLQRVKLEELPDDFTELLSDMRRDVYDRADELLAFPSSV